jgi:hypothetical protein
VRLYPLDPIFLSDFPRHFFTPCPEFSFPHPRERARFRPSSFTPRPIR